MSSTLQSLFKQTAVYGLSSIVGRFLNYLLVPLYTSVFVNPSDYGVVSELYAWVAFLIVLLTFGMETTFFRFIQGKDNKQKVFKNALWFVILLTFLFLIIILFFHQQIANLLLFNEHSEYIVLLSLIVSIDAISALPLAKLREENRAFKFARIQLSSIFVNILLNLIFMLFLFNSKRPEEGVLFILLANLIASFIKPILLRRDFSVLTMWPDGPALKGMFFYSFPLVLAGFAGIINETIDRIMIKQILFEPNISGSLEYAESQVGIYSACYKLAMLVTIFIQAYRYAAEPFFFKQLQNKNKNEIYVKVMNIFVAFVGLVFLIVSVNLDWLKYFIQNEVYWEGISIVPILLIANIFLGIYINQSIWYKLSEQTKYALYIALIGGGVTIVGNYIFIPIYGYVASAWVTLIVYGIQMIISYILGQIYYPIPYSLPKIFLYLSIAFLLFIIFYWLHNSNVLWSLVIGNLFVILYLILVIVFEKNNLAMRN